MISYHNDPAVKELYQARFAQHRERDQVIQGTGYEDGRGCFVGCTLNNYTHQRFETELGWPHWLAHLADYIFEGISAAVAPQFGTDLLAAVPVGADLEPLRWQLAIGRHRAQLETIPLLDDPLVHKLRERLHEVIELCELCVLHRPQIGGRTDLNYKLIKFRSTARDLHSELGLRQEEVPSTSQKSLWQGLRRFAASAEQTASLEYLGPGYSAWHSVRAYRSIGATGTWDLERDKLLELVAQMVPVAETLEVDHYQPL